MKTLIISLIAAIPLSLSAVEKSGDKSLTEKTTATLEKAGEKTKEAGSKLVEGTKKAASTAVDAITPDADAHKVDVKLNENRLDLPKKLQSGKTGFIVHNDGKESHSFEIKGEGIDKKFLMSVPPNETKVLHVDLKPGSYKAFCPEKGPEHKGMSADISVK
jgi:uncharacterized cupredoxin-like copper-binding protein